MAAGNQPGFTLIELVAILLIAGILALVALPRMTQFSVFDQRGFADQTISAMRYAQKTAIAQRRWVQVTDQGNGFSLSFCSGIGTDGCVANTANCAGAVSDPSTGSAFSVSAPSGVTLAHTGTSPFYFDCEGRPVNAAGQSIGSGVYTISSAGAADTTFAAESETGYVH